MEFQEIILALQRLWSEQGCILGEPYDVEKGAGTMNPFTFLRVLGPEPWNVAYVEPSRRPADGRYGDNPNRLYQHHQFQVIMKPSPDNIQELYLASLERLAMYIQGVENVYDIQWTGDYTYGDVFHQNEFEQSTYAFDLSDADLLFDLFDKYEAEAVRVIEKGYVHPAYDYVLKCSHAFNLLDARGAISVSERAAFIGRVRKLARLCAQCYLKQREELGYPMMGKGNKA